MKPLLGQTEFWVGTFHGSHDGLPAKVTAARDDTRPEPYVSHPTRFDQLRSWAFRRFR